VEADEHGGCQEDVVRHDVELQQPAAAAAAAAAAITALVRDMLVRDPSA
jgi:hypothetical protein